MRLSDLSSVDLPHPDGPIIAITSPVGNAMSMFLKAWKSPLIEIHIRDIDLGFGVSHRSELLC